MRAAIIAGVAFTLACGGKEHSRECGPTPTPDPVPVPAPTTSTTKNSLIEGTLVEISPRGPLPVRYQEVHFRHWPAGTLVEIRLSSSHRTSLAIYNTNDPGNDDQPQIAATGANSVLLRFFVGVSGRHRLRVLSKERGARYQLELTTMAPAIRDKRYLAALFKTLEPSVNNLANYGWERITTVVRLRCAWDGRARDCYDSIVESRGRYAYGLSEEETSALASRWRDWFVTGLPVPSHDYH